MKLFKMFKVPLNMEERVNTTNFWENRDFGWIKRTIISYVEHKVYHLFISIFLLHVRGKYYIKQINLQKFDQTGCIATEFRKKMEL